MKKFLIPFLLLSLLASAQESVSPDAKAEGKETPKYLTELQALSEDDKKNYLQHLQQCQTLFSQRRIFECLAEVHSAHLIYDKNPVSLNIQGSCYVEFRDFEKASRCFKKSLAQDPRNLNVRFNIAEVAFVMKKYEESKKLFSSLAEELGDSKNHGSVQHIIQFKVFLCHIKTDQEAKAQAMLEKADFLDDSPFFYYAKAAIAHSKDDGKEANQWVQRASRIYPPAEIQIWQDSLIEVGYVKSFIGEGEENEK